MKLIEYEQVIPEINCFCKVFHSQLIEKEKKVPPVALFLTGIAVTNLMSV